MRVIVNCLLCCFVLMLMAVEAFASPTSKVTVRVTDENGQPMKNSEVEVWYIVGNRETTNKGLSDDKGLFVSTGESLLPQLTVYSRYQGYYESCVIYKFDKRSLLNRWEPWNPTAEVTLKKKHNPVAMFSNNTDIIKIPIVNEPAGYDLEKGDWVAPYGKGTISDFFFTLRTNYKSYSQYLVSLSIGFSNKEDGIQEYFSSDKDQSYFKWPFDAPDDGYKYNLSREKSDSPEKGMFKNTKENAKYIFRVRTKVDKAGKIVSANYGKIPDEFGFDPTGNVRFSYCFNPDGTRNLEFDPEKNLFKWTREQRNHMVKNP